ncbi:MAG: LCP family protein [Lachnospiraceae bacterium]|nr:LCP family protein [Lachnospiraceae bacterium]
MSANKNKYKRRRIGKIVLLTCELLILVGLAGFLYIWRSVDKIQKHETVAENVGTHVEAEHLGINMTEIPQESVEKQLGYTSVALFGVDNLYNGHAESGNSDVILVASINNDTKDVKLVSIYRDTFLDTEPMSTENSLHKCNRAYHVGGAEQAIQMLNKSLDLDIHNYITVDFKAVTDVVNLLGGVEIDVTSSEVFYINKHAKTTAKATGITTNDIYGAGVHLLDGTQATAYCRIRSTAGSDFKRAERQRRVINELVKKAKACDINTLNNIIDTVFPEIYTSYTNAELIALASSMLDYELSDTVGFPFSKNAVTLGKGVGAVVVPCDLASNVTALHRFLYEDEAYVPSNTVQAYSTAIQNTAGMGIENGDNKAAVDGSGSITLDDFENETQATD